MNDVSLLNIVLTSYHVSTKRDLHLQDSSVGSCESVQEFDLRLVSFFSELIGNLCKIPVSSNNVLVVSHGMAIRKLFYLLNRFPQEFGIHKWTRNSLTEKILKNATYHKILLQISTDQAKSDIKVNGQVSDAHFRMHLDG